MSLVGRRQSDDPGDRVGRGVRRVHVRDDLRHRLRAQPVGERAGRFTGNATSLPRHAHHPGDLGDEPAVGRADRRLHRAGEAAGGT